MIEDTSSLICYIKEPDWGLRRSVCTRTYCFPWQGWLQEGEEEDGRKVADKFVATPDLEAHQSVPTKDAVMFLFLPGEAESSECRERVNQARNQEWIKLTICAKSFHEAGSSVWSALCNKRRKGAVTTHNKQLATFFIWDDEFICWSTKAEKISKTEITNIFWKADPGFYVWWAQFFFFLFLCGIIFFFILQLGTYLVCR